MISDSRQPESPLQVRPMVTSISLPAAWAAHRGASAGGDARKASLAVGFRPEASKPPSNHLQPAPQGHGPLAPAIGGSPVLPTPRWAGVPQHDPKRAGHPCTGSCLLKHFVSRSAASTMRGFPAARIDKPADHSWVMKLRSRLWKKCRYGGRLIALLRCQVSQLRFDSMA